MLPYSSIKICQFWYLVVKSHLPKDKKWFHIVDKWFFFETDISCAIFQSFSDAVAPIVNFLVNRVPMNYLDDFSIYCILAINLWSTNRNLLCEDINFLSNMEKTVWSTSRMRQPKYWQHVDNTNHVLATGLVLWLTAIFWDQIIKRSSFVDNPLTFCDS